MISYAQNFEDVMLARAFKGQEKGFYIDIGAWNAEIDSVTKHFYDNGWHGINIEPADKCFQDLCTHRQRDINLNIAVGRTRGKKIFFDFEPRGNSTLDGDLADSFIERGYPCTEKTIDVLTLAEVCEWHAPAIIDFLKIDVEGAESDVLHGGDWSRFRPRVLVIEAVKPFTYEPQWDEWEPYLLQQGYSFVYFDGLNRFYVRNEEKSLAEHFALPPNILDEFQTRTNLFLQEQNNKLQEFIGDLQEQNSALQEHNDALGEQIGARQAEAEALCREIEAWSRRAQDAEGQLSAVLGSRSFRLGHAIRRLARPALPVLRPVARLARGGRGKLRSCRNRWYDAHRPVRRSTLLQRYHQALAPGQVYSFPYGVEEKSVFSRIEGAPLANIRAALDNDLTSPVPSIKLLTESIDATRRHEDDVLSRARLDLRTRAAILQAEMIEALQSHQNAFAVSKPARSVSQGGEQPIVIIDVRCLQDPGYLNRGIGRHARHVLGTVFGLYKGKKELVLLTDVSLPELNHDIAALGDICITTSSGLNIENVDLLIELSPMTVSPGPLLRLLLDPGISKAALVYDFIPGEFPDYYLATDDLWLLYRARLAALAGYDLFLAISDVTAARLPHFIGRDVPVAITGVANPLQGLETTENHLDGAPLPFSSFVLVTGGADNRKNLLAAIVAHASCTGISRRRLGLAVIGEHTAEMIEAAQNFARKCGMGTERLKFFSGLDNIQLQSLYERADVVVVPSFTEGFSMPVVEAIMAGTPVVASDIDAHRELIGAGWWLAPPEDPVALGKSVARALKDPRALLQQQRATVGDRFLAEKVADRLRRAFASALPSQTSTEPARSHPVGKRRPRLAVLTPMPPQQSGVAAYSAFTMQAVTRYADVDIYTDSRCRLDGSPGIELHPYSLQPFISNDFDAVISVIGNSHFHIPILEYFLEFGGACIAHDPRMTELYHIMRGSDALASLLSRHSDQPVLPEDLQDFLYYNDLDQLPSIVYDEIAPSAQPMLVHTSGLSERIQKETGAEPLVLPYVPHHLPEVDRIDNEVILPARRSLGWQDDARHIASFGIVDQHTKAVEVILDAVAWLRRWGMDCHLHLVGPASSTERNELTQRARRLGISEWIHITGWLPDDRRASYLLAADAAVQLRTFTHSPVSGALLDCMAYGVPSVATESLAKSMQAPPYVSTISDRFSGLLLAESLASLLKERRLDSYARCETQRREWLADRTGDLYAKKLLGALGLEEFTV